MTVSAASVLTRWGAFEEVLATLSRGVPCLRADGLWGSSRALAIAGVLIVGGPWMLNQLLSYTTDLWSRIPTLVG